MGEKYEGYSKSLKFLNLDSLHERREKSALMFAKKSVMNESFANFFPKQPKGHIMRTRYSDRYKVNKAHTERYRRSAIPYLQRLLIDDHQRQKKILKTLLQVNNDVFL